MKSYVQRRRDLLAAVISIVGILASSSLHAQAAPAGGAALRAEITSVEGPLPVTDTAVNGQFTLTPASPVTLTGWVVQLVVQKKQPGGETKEIQLGQDTEQKNSITYPLVLKAGQAQATSFMVLMDVKIPAALQQLGYADARAALKDPTVRLLAKASVRVRGAAAATEAQREIKLIP